MLNSMSQSRRVTTAAKAPRVAPIFTLTSFTRDGSDRRVFGWFPRLARARRAAARDEGSMSEALYQWLLIERVDPGIHGRGSPLEWYSWSHPRGKQGGWVKRARGPKWHRPGIINYSIG